MDRPAPQEYQPPLRLWSHVWRVLLMLVVSGVAWLPVAETQVDEHPSWFVADILVGLAGYVAVFYRRRWPIPIALALTMASAVSGVVAGPAVLALTSLATRRRWRELAVIGSVSFAAAQLFSVIYPTDDSEPTWIILGVNAVFTAAILAWGMYIGSRRELIWTLRHRAERAEDEQELRVGQARSNERARIAREMHDVLAHRITQISMYAGALAYREDLTTTQMRASAGLIRDQAHEALTDLRDVLGVLRDDDGEGHSAPQPTYADLPCLVEEAREAGLRIDLEDLVTHTDHAKVPDGAGRTVYRIVQEGITNARKHASGALLTVRITGSPEDGIDVVLRNPLGFGPTQTPGAGLGLIGLTERAELRGGRLEARREGSTFVMHGWIPWGA